MTVDNDDDDDDDDDDDVRKKKLANNWSTESCERCLTKSKYNLSVTTAHDVGQLATTQEVRGSIRSPGQSLSALSSMSVVVVTAAMGITVVGVPMPMSHLHLPHRLLGRDYIDAMQVLTPITLCMSLFVKNLYALVYRKRIGTVWYSKPPPIEGYWQGGMPSAPWLKLVSPAYSDVPDVANVPDIPNVPNVSKVTGVPDVPRKKPEKQQLPPKPKEPPIEPSSEKLSDTILPRGETASLHLLFTGSSNRFYVLVDV
ncbi:hypothetical protein PoB_005901200 [Plakobranchus ocellatus]|uniref:G-protein coupled receptors family 1 profile domain-containing protein n=1 Tax=Plakobranchus ocellatus TaxID=259542 RepID=A0AAV4CLT0_9GAST|nr:hypothetical protein PoB_005901200 [Plakobranchus ocellatus]